VITANNQANLNVIFASQLHIVLMTVGKIINLSMIRNALKFKPRKINKTKIKILLILPIKISLKIKPRIKIVPMSLDTEEVILNFKFKILSNKHLYLLGFIKS
jgi:hypothetical protein